MDPINYSVKLLLPSSSSDINVDKVLLMGPPSHPPPEKKRKQKEEEELTKKRKTMQDESSESEKTPKVKIPFLYFNAQSLNPNNKSESMNEKREKIKELIKEKNPQIIAVTETWLTDQHSDDQVLETLGLSRADGWEIIRQDRQVGHPSGTAYNHHESKTGVEDKRGGGLMVAYRKESPLSPTGPRITVSRDTSEDFGDNVMNLDIRVTTVPSGGAHAPATERKLAMVLAYRRPSPGRGESKENFAATNQVVEDRLAHLPAWFNDFLSPYDGYFMVGDFNYQTQQGHMLEQIQTFDPCSDIQPGPDVSTHKHGGSLDKVISSEGLVNNVQVSKELVSDHKALAFDVNPNYEFDEELNPDNFSNRPR